AAGPRLVRRTVAPAAPSRLFQAVPLPLARSEPMSLRLSSLWRPDAVIHRLPYFLTGAGLLALKHSLDWAAATQFFQRSWQPFNYFVLPSQTVGVLMLPEHDRLFYGTLLALALPFIAIGVLLTVQRLRAVRLPVALVLF